MYRNYAYKKLEMQAAGGMLSGLGGFGGLMGGGRGALGNANSNNVRDPLLKKQLNKFEKKQEAKKIIGNKYNSLENLKEARNNLIAKTGKEKFSMEEILNEIKGMKKISGDKVRII
jgi:hypothetical protein